MNIKTSLILLMSAQILFYAYLIYQITSGNIYLGIINIILNSAFFISNVYTLRRLHKF